MSDHNLTSYIEQLKPPLGRKEHQMMVINSWLDYGLTYSNYDTRASTVVCPARAVRLILVYTGGTGQTY